MEEDKRNKIAVLLDLENVVFRHIRSGDPEKYSLKAGFDNLLGWLENIGKIAMFCVFFPSYLLQKGRLQAQDLEYFYRKRIFPIICPKIGSEKEDTVDATLIQWGSKVLFPHMSGITHLCIGSGDMDFLQLQEEAQKRGLKLVIVAGTPGSLSSEVGKGVDKNPQTGEPMIHYFSPYID